MAGERIELVVPEEYHLERADRFLAHALELDLSRSHIQKLIRNGNILVNEASIRPNHRIKTGDAISIEIPEPERLALEPQDIPIEIIYEDGDCAVINKPPGMVVHPGSGNWSGTLVNALLFHMSGLSSIGGVERPGIVHRLDKDTAGLMVVAKNDRAHSSLAEQLAGRTMAKRYIAIVTGKPLRDHDLIDEPIGRHQTYRHKMTVREDGREAITEYFLKKIYNLPTGLYSRLEIALHTGRTHQIRVHLASRGLPVVGDPIYSKKWERHRVPYLLLASIRLEFTHPGSGKRMDFSIDPPSHILQFINKLEKLVRSAE